MKKILLFLVLSLLFSNSFAFNYNIGTKEQYDLYQEEYQRANDWTELQIANGKISTYISGTPRLDAIRTTKAFNINYENPDSKIDECVWQKYTENEIATLDEAGYKTKINEWYPDIQIGE